MKKLVFLFVIVAACLLSVPVFSQIQNEPTALGLPGDNLNLYAVLDVFQKSKTLEEFENALNGREQNINNLDLNNDNLTDYIEVVSHKQGDSFSIVLRTAINNTEYQDIAVIEVNKTNSEKIFVQVIGDKDLYGRDYIVEPSGTIYNARNPNPAYAGDDYSRGNVGVNTVVYVNDWPIIFDLFSPAFQLYISPWHWGYYPSFWRPRAPIFFFDYWGFNNHYYRNRYYRRGGYVRYPNHYRDYSNTRRSSGIVREHNRTGNYRSTYNGRTFRRPEAPARVTNPPIRQGDRQPTGQRTRPNRQRSDVPIRQSQPQREQRNNVPRNTQTQPQTRQGNERPARQQSQPVNRQRIPGNRQVDRPARINRTNRPDPVRDRN